VWNLDYNLAYQFAIVPSSDMMNDLVRVVLFLPDEAITVL
jgi:hypothetical protein